MIWDNHYNYIIPMQELQDVGSTQDHVYLLLAS